MAMVEGKLVVVNSKSKLSNRDTHGSGWHAEYASRTHLLQTMTHVDLMHDKDLSQPRAIAEVII